MEVTDEMLMDQILEGQIQEAPSEGTFEQTNEKSQQPKTETPIEQKQEVSENLPPINHNPLAGQKLSFIPGDRSSLISEESKEESARISEERHISRAGDNLFANAEAREGWIPVNKDLLGKRAYFYPDSWQFKIRPATVEAIRNWSNIDEENFIAMDDIFNEILKSCLAIVTPQGMIPWGNINSWDRFYFLLLIREFTFVEGEYKFSYTEDCPECDNPVTFNLLSSSLMYEFPDEEILHYYDRENRCWRIDPEEFDVVGDPIVFYLPTLDKDANIKSWIISRVQENNNRKFDQTFMRFLPWLTPKISKDSDIVKRQIKELEMKYKSWNMELFTFFNDVLRNINVMPKDKLITTCPVCGEEVTAAIRFPRSVSDLFDIPNKHRKFGSR